MSYHEHDGNCDDYCDECYEEGYDEGYSAGRRSSQRSSGNHSGGSNNGGCYVATAVYGSYDCPEVWTLRRFRDGCLAKHTFGRAFIRTYYAISPTLVKWFGETRWFKRIWRGVLDHMVVTLNRKGVANTSYQDQKW